MKIEVDQFVESGALDIADHVADSQFAYIRGASHFAPMTAIDTFHRIIETFLRGEELPREAWDR